MTTLLIAYITPETTLPIASVIAASIGFVLTIGRATWKFLKKTKQAVVGEPRRMIR